VGEIEFVISEVAGTEEIFGLAMPSLPWFENKCERLDKSMEHVVNAPESRYHLKSEHPHPEQW
jgi:hypothetical protein